jgi:hypothetical protein
MKGQGPAVPWPCVGRRDLHVGFQYALGPNWVADLNNQTFVLEVHPLSRHLFLQVVDAENTELVVGSGAILRARSGDGEATRAEDVVWAGGWNSRLLSGRGWAYPAVLLAGFDPVEGFLRPQEERSS